MLTLVIKKDLDEGSLKELLEDVTKNFSKLEKEDLWGVKNLSYPIKRQTSAYYAHYEFEVESKNISSLDKKLKLNEDIIRYLLLKK